MVACLEDATGSRAEVKQHIRAAAAGQAAAGAARQLGQLIAAMTGCVPIWAYARFPFLEAAPRAAGAGSDVHRAAVLIFETDVIEQYCILEIASIKPEYISATEPHRIDTDRQEIQDLIAAYLAGIWVSPFGYKPTKLLAAIVENREQ